MSGVMTSEQRRVLRWVVCCWGLAGAIAIVGHVVGRWVFIGIRFSPSIAGHVFLVFPGAPVHRGDLLAFWPPRTPYAPPTMWWMKYAVGMPGDLLQVENRHLRVAGINRGICAQRAVQDNHPLHCMHSTHIPQQHYFVWGSHPRSLDSRYQEIGFVQAHAVIGRGMRLF